MSVSSSAPSTQSSRSSWRLNDRLLSLMESLYAIVAGLGLRLVVDTVSRHDFKITGTLVGLWEGVILLHFLKKLPKSTDPYLAFAVRLFIDFLVTESISRLVLVLTWTGMGMILADVAPAIWEDAGLRRIWRRFRRDLFVISESIPTVVFFPPTRTVRFSPSREPSVIAEAEEEGEPDADALTEPRSIESSTSAEGTEQGTPVNIEPTSIRRRLPGYFPGTMSDTESVLSSVIGRSIRLPSTFTRDSERTSRRLSVYPIRTEDTSETSSQVDDDIKLSSPSSTSTVTADPADTTRFTDDIQITEDFDTTQLTDIPDEEEHKPSETTNSANMAMKKDHPFEEEITPRSVPIFLPPTPSDSQRPRRRQLSKDDHTRPLSASIPQIPDMPEASDEWEKIQKEDASDAEAPWEQVQREDAVDADKPPPPPPKDWPETNPLFTNANDSAGFDETTTNEHRRSQPPPYDFLDDHDDIYEDHPSNMKPSGAAAGHASHPDRANPLQREEEEKRLEEEAAEKRRKEEEAAEQKRVEEEAAAAERLRDEQKRREEAEKKRKEEEAEQKRVEEAAEQKRREEEAEKRKEEAAEQKRRQEEAEKKRTEEEAAEQKMLEEAAAAAAAAAEMLRLEEQKRKEEEAEKKRKQEEAEKKRKEEEAAAERRRQEEEAEQERLEEAKQQRLTEEEKERLKEEAAEQKRREDEAEQQRLKEAEKQQLKEEEKKGLEGEAAEQKLDEAEQQGLKEEEQQEEKKGLEGEAAEQKLDEAEQQGLKEEEQPRLKEEEKNRLEAEAETHQSQQAGNASAPSTSPLAETQRTDGQHNPETVEEPAQANEEGNEELESEDQHRMEIESVATDQSAIPGDVESRLSRILVTKAQIVEIRSVIDELETRLEDAGDESKGGIEDDLKRAQKVLEKMKKKEQRRRDDAVPLQVEPGLNDGADFISFDALGAPEAKTRMLEKMEELLSPDATSLRLTFSYGTKRFAKNQKPAVTEVLTAFNLLGSTIRAKEQTTIHVPDERFSEWLTEYRTSITQPDDMDV